MNRHSRDTCPGMQELRQKRVNERDVVSVIPEVWEEITWNKGRKLFQIKEKAHMKIEVNKNWQALGPEGRLELC